MGLKRRVGRPTLPSLLLREVHGDSSVTNTAGPHQHSSPGSRLKGRKELRKEARKAKHTRREAWASHQNQGNGQDATKPREKVGPVEGAKPERFGSKVRERSGAGKVPGASVAPSKSVKEASKGEGAGKGDQRGKKRSREEGKGLGKGRGQGEGGEKRKRPSTSFEQLLELEKGGELSREEDLELEQRLAKKLKIKKGHLPGDDDMMNWLLGFGEGEEEDEEEREGDEEEREEDEDEEEDEEEIWEEEEEEDVGEEEEEEDEEEDEEGEEVEEQYAEDTDGSFDDEDEESEDGILDEGDRLQGVVQDEEDEAEQDSEEDEEGEADGRGESGEEEQAVRKSLSGDEEEIGAGKGKGRGVEGVPAGRDGDAGKHGDEGKKAERGAAGMYVAPHLRQAAADGKSEELVRVERRLRGLLNRLSESNVENIAGEVAIIFQTHGRSLVGKCVSDEILNACVSGPRGNDQYAAVFAAFISGTAATVGMDFGANFVSSLAQRFEEQYEAADSLALRNLTLLLAHLYTFSSLASDVIYDFLEHLCHRFAELDVASMLHLLQACGMGLRGDDPQAMKDFIMTVQARAVKAQQEFLKAAAQEGESLSQDPKEGQAGLSKRVRFMLDTIVDIKNNRKRTPEVVPHTRLKKWLQKLGVEEVQLRVVTWQRLLDPSKKGQWWLPAPAGAGGDHPASAGMAGRLAGAIDADVAEADKMLQLAASQRMNTDARRAVFCVVMSGEDYVDAFEKVLRLKLPGKQDREILRVVAECCLQEAAFNPYYALLAARLCSHDRNHKFTLQFLLWDHFKQLPAMELRRSANLARFLAHILGSFALSLTCLKAVDFGDPKVMTPKVVVHFRILFEVLLTEFPKETVWAVFTRIAAPPSLASLRDNLAVFLHQHVRVHAVTVAETQGQKKGELLVKRCRLTKKALENVAGVLLK